MIKRFTFFIIISLFTLPLFADMEDTIRNPIPTEYNSFCEQAGTTDLVVYQNGNTKKTAVIYLPYGYNSEDKETRYPVLYLMHGGGGSAASYLGGARMPNRLCWIMDHAIKNKEIKPVIIVCPNDNGIFYLELRNKLIPTIDERYNTIADREHRAFGGFSMGAVATWNIFLHDLDLVKNYIPMSGDSWVCGSTGGKTFPEKTALMLAHNSSFISDYTKNDYLIFAATGGNDMAYPNLTPQIQAMKNETDAFTYTTKDFSEGNLIYYVVKGNVHDYGNTYEYIYNALKLFF